MQWDIRQYGAVDSTQDVLKGLLRDGRVHEGIAVQAESQSSGRGRHGRQWVSGKGNLYLSFLLCPSKPIHETPQLAFVCGLALAQAVKPLLKVPSLLSLKWPNDVLIEGRKIAGILIEADSIAGENFVIVGLGLNISTSPPEGSAVSRYVKKNAELAALRDSILAVNGQLYSLWQEEGFAPIRDLWLNEAHRAGTPLSVNIGGKIEVGTFESVDENGHLILCREDGSGHVKITTGDVFL